MGSRLHPFPFFVGAGRSGTTLLRAMFDSHPDVTIPRESRFIVRMERRRRVYEADGRFHGDRFVRDFIGMRRFGTWELPAKAVEDEFSSRPIGSFSDAIRCLYALHARLQDKTRYGDKTPGYVRHMPLLAELFPEARFVHIIRDGRNVALSSLQLRGWGAKSVEEAAVDWARQVRIGRRAGERLGPRRYMEINYEELIDDTKGVVQRLCGFLELPFADSMLRYYERADRVAGDIPHFQNLYRPPTKGLRDWRTEMNPASVRVFEALAGGMLEDLGYERATAGSSVGTMVPAAWRRTQVYSRWAMDRLSRSARIVRKAGV